MTAPGRPVVARPGPCPWARTGRPTAWWADAAIAGQVVAVAALAYLHVAFGDKFSATSRLVSDYALFDAAAAPYAVGLLALAAAGGALAVGMFGQRHLLGRAVPALLGLSSCAVVLAVVFPTDPTGMAGAAPAAPTTASGQIHRLATAIAFVGPPGAGWLFTRRLTAGTPARPRPSTRAVGWLTAGCWTSLGAFVLSHLPVSSPDTPVAALFGDRAIYGLTERIALSFEIGLLLALSLSLLRARRVSGADPAGRR